MGRRPKGVALEAEAKMERLRKKTVTLYDAGGLIIIWALFGLPLGVALDYIWNWLVFSLALPRLPGIATANPGREGIGRGKRIAFIFLVTLLGVVIDWGYFELTWNVGLGKGQLWAPAMSQPLQLVSILIPIVMLCAVDFALAYAYLRLDRKPALVLGGLMALFTAPWILPTLPYLLRWTV